VSAAIVAHRGARRLGDRVERAEQLFDRFLLEIGMILEGGVEILT
jgi:hypothetical protein